MRRGDWLPPALGALAALAGAVNVASALSPEITERVAVLTQVAPARMVPIATALALPAGAALLIAGGYLAARRRHAWALATTLLIVLGVLNLMKGLDVEEALLSWSLAGLLIWGREAFYVRHPAGSLAAAARQVPLVLGTAFGVALVTLWATRARVTPDLTWGGAVREAAGLLTLTGGPLHFRDGAHWVPAGLGILGVGAMAMAAALVFRPLAAPSARARRRRPRPRAPAGAGPRPRHPELLQAPRRRPLRVRAGRARVPGLPDRGRRDARLGRPGRRRGRRARTAAAASGPWPRPTGLRLALLAGSDGVLDVARQAGLRSLYIGDEAIVDVAGFSLEGRPIRKVRQSVTRLERAGYRLSLDRQGDLPAGALAELQAVSAHWLDGRPERGFAMALDRLGGGGQDDCLVLVARDADGAARGFLQLVPCYGRPAVSLSLMRRDRDTPNGLTEFMVARCIELLRERGIEELSLNFAAFGRWLRAPHGRAERVLGRVIAPLDRWFQIESLLRFNGKFHPRWEPRYLCFQGRLGLPRAGLAALWAEGQLPRPRAPRLHEPPELLLARSPQEAGPGPPAPRGTGRCRAPRAGARAGPRRPAAPRPRCRARPGSP